MANKNDENFIAFCNELRTYVEEHHLFPAKHHRLLNQIKYVRKKIKAGTLEDWKQEMFEEIENSRDLSIKRKKLSKEIVKINDILLKLSTTFDNIFKLYLDIGVYYIRQYCQI